MLTKSGHFWTTYLPRPVNVSCERPLTRECIRKGAVGARIHRSLGPGHHLFHPQNFRSLDFNIYFSCNLLHRYVSCHYSKILFNFSLKKITAKFLSASPVSIMILILLGKLFIVLSSRIRKLCTYSRQGRGTTTSFWVSSALDCSVCRWHWTQF